MSGYTVGEIAAWLGLAAVLGFALGWLVRELQVRAVHRPEQPEPTAPAPVAPEPATEPAPGEAPTSEHVIKGNTKSGIYHLPSSPSYARMTAGAWFRTEEEAQAAGYRRAGKPSGS